MENGDLVIKYKVAYSIDGDLDKKVDEFFKTLGYKSTGSGLSFYDNVRDISFTKED